MIIRAVPRTLLCLGLLLWTIVVHPQLRAIRGAGHSPSTALAISEIMYNPPARDNLDGALFEFLELVNHGATSIDLSGASFSDGIEFTFAAGTEIAPGVHLVLAHSASTFAATYGFAPAGEYRGKLDNAGERITLRDREGEVLISLVYDDKMPWPVAADGCGYSLVPINGEGASDDGSMWRRSSQAGGSPGRADPALTAAPVRVNEVLAHTDPPQQDAVELHNPTAAAVDLGGWFLTDDPTAVRKFRIPDCTWIDAAEYRVFTEEEMGFALSALSEEIYLVAADERGERLGYEDGAIFGATPNGVSVGRHTTSTGAAHFPLQISVTLGAPNAGPRVGPVVISELMYHPLADRHEYIVLANISAEPVPLYDPQHPDNVWRLTGVGEYAFPPDTVMPAGSELLVVPLAPAEFRGRYAIPASVPIVGPYAGQLSNSGELIQLMQPDTPNVDGNVPYFTGDAVEYEDGPPWPTAPDGGGASLVRVNRVAYGDDPANWRARFPQRTLFLPLIQR
jgi:hypothetical protein